MAPLKVSRPGVCPIDTKVHAPAHVADAHVRLNTDIHTPHTKVYAPALVAATARQTSVFPWARNRVHIALAANVGLDPADDATVIVHGLLGSPSGQDRYKSVYFCMCMIVHGVHELGSSAALGNASSRGSFLWVQAGTRQFICAVCTHA